MKLFRILAFNILLAIGSIEIISFIFLKKQVRIIFSEYWQGPKTFGRGYPRNHFIKHSERGFDIAPDSKPVFSNQPKEIQPYPVWGNNIGCFDKTIKNKSKYSIYLAGDSFTWGYAPLKNKFGSILENKLKVKVAACGVTHTGQKHQFQKFKDITQKLGYFPEIVFVNVVMNDIDNDFSHPHTTIIGGYQVNNVKIDKIASPPVITRIDDDFLNSRLAKRINAGTYARFGRLDPRKYSATSVLFYAGLYKPFLDKSKSKTKSQFKLKTQSNSQVKSEKCKSLNVYGVAKCVVDASDIGYPINSQVAKNNRKAIKEWIAHSIDHRYSLVFADINTQFFNYQNEYLIPEVKNRQFFCEFIKKQNSICFSFVNYLDDIGVENWNKIRWKRDGHFNIIGNQIYSDFLIKIYREIK